MANFLLIHGMFHGGWCWRSVARAIEAHGHRVAAPDLAGCGADATPAAEVSLARWTTDITAVAEAFGEPIILVGHSRGGVIASAVAEAIPDKVAAIIYLAAIMLPDGAAAIDVPKIMIEQGLPPSVSALVPRMSSDGLQLLAPDGVDTLLYHECAEEDRGWAASLIGGEPLIPLTQPVSLTVERWGRVPRIYIETIGDRTLDIAAQRAMIARSPPDEVISLATDHMPILSHPEEVAGLLIDVALRYRPA